MTNLILCGGSGTRLWPLSRDFMPKQFVKLFDEESLFQTTVKRNSAFCDKSFVVSNINQYFLAMDQLEEIGKNKNVSYLLEPIGRNTAGAIALTLFDLSKEEIVLVTPSDHLIKDLKSYEEALKKAVYLANENKLVTFGIKPTYPETGYGYIESEESLHVKNFIEKPDIENAKEFIKKSNYFWNSGMFCFKAGVFLDELKKYSPNVFKSALNAYDKAKIEQKSESYEKLIRVNHDDMLNIPSISIDYALMEKTDNLFVVPSDISWNDVGSFDSLSKELPNDEYNNFILSDKEVALIDVDNLIVVDTKDALLVSKKGSSQKVKNVVKNLKNCNKKELTSLHVKAYRPWGTYEVLEESIGYKIKKIIVKPGKRLSLQKHYHRNEHWIVVSGNAKVILDEKSFFLAENESTYIKAGQIHRLENHEKLPLVIIEVQVGSYTGEDDIERIEDDYQRIYN